MDPPVTWRVQLEQLEGHRAAAAPAEGNGSATTSFRVPSSARLPPARALALLQQALGPEERAAEVGRATGSRLAAGTPQPSPADVQAACASLLASLADTGLLGGGAHDCGASSAPGLDLGHAQAAGSTATAGTAACGAHGRPSARPRGAAPSAGLTGGNDRGGIANIVSTAVLATATASGRRISGRKRKARHLDSGAVYSDSDDSSATAASAKHPRRASAAASGSGRPPAGICPVCNGPGHRGRYDRTNHCQTCYNGLYNDAKKVTQALLKHGKVLTVSSDVQEDLRMFQEQFKKHVRVCRTTFKCPPSSYRHSLPVRQRCQRCRTLATLRLLPEFSHNILKTVAGALEEDLQEARLTRLLSKPRAGSLSSASSSSRSGQGHDHRSIPSTLATAVREPIHYAPVHPMAAAAAVAAATSVPSMVPVFPGATATDGFPFLQMLSNPYSMPMPAFLMPRFTMQLPNTSLMPHASAAPSAPGPPPQQGGLRPFPG